MNKISNSLADGSAITKMIEKLEGKLHIKLEGDVNSDILYWFSEIIYRRLLSYDVSNWYVLPFSGKIEFGSKGQ